MRPAKLTCTARIYPPGLAGIGAAHNCGNPSKGLNSEGRPRCGIHSDEANARRTQKQEARDQAERERVQRWNRASYRNALSTMTEAEARAIFRALEMARNSAALVAVSADLARALAKLDAVDSERF